MKINEAPEYLIEKDTVRQEERIAYRLIKNILLEAFLLLLVFLFENRAYLFSYLPHASEYEKQMVRIETTLRGSYARVRITDGKAVKGYVKHAFYEGRDDVIVVGYAPQRGRRIVRTSPVITSYLSVIFGVFVLGNIRTLRAISKGGGDSYSGG